MKKTLFLLIVLFVVSGVPQVFAYDYGVSVGDRVSWNGSSVGSGGEFGFTNSTTGFKWSTFCAERSQHLKRHNTVDGIGDSNWKGDLINGGPTGSYGPTPGFLTENAAWAYWNFSHETLAGYDSSDTNDQNDLQQLIWLEMGQISTASYYDSSQVDQWLALASTDFSTGWTNNGLVQVLQFTDSQDVLVAATNPVPEPASMALLGIGLIGLVVVGRKKVKKN